MNSEEVGRGWIRSWITALFLLCTLPLLLSAQPSGGGRNGGGVAVDGKIVGTIVDGGTGEGIPGATVAVWRLRDSTLISGGAARVTGEFSIEGIPAGRYYAIVSSLGFTNYRIDSIVIMPARPTFSAGTIRMVESDSADGSTVTVTAERSDVEFRADRTIYNVEDQPISAGGNAIDVLKNVPQIDIDIDDNVSLRGSQNVVVLINGRTVPMTGEALAAYLRSLSAEDVKSIEIIPNPSAKYDPDGMAGIVNIVLKNQRSEENLSGVVSIGAGTTNSYNASASLNWKKDKLNIFGGYSFRYDDRESERTLYRENRLSDPVTILDQTGNDERTGMSHNINTTIEYGLGEYSTISLSSLLGIRSSDQTGQLSYNTGVLGESAQSNTLRLTPGSNDNLNLNAGLAYRWIREPGRNEFSVEAKVSNNSGKDIGNYTESLVSQPDSVVERQNSQNEDQHRELSLQADYVRPLGENGRLELGYKSEIDRVDNSIYSETFDPLSAEFQPDIDRNNDFVYDQWLNSAYAIVASKIGPLDAQVGLRAENAATLFNLQTTQQEYENNYFSLFPSAALAYGIGQGTKIRASYSRRVRRPNVWQLNPFPQYEDRLNVRTGNPELLPEYTNSFELGLNQFLPWGTISITPYYRRTTGEIERYLLFDSTGLSNLTFANYSSSDSYGAELVATVRIAKRFSGFLNLSAYRLITDASNLESDLSNDAFGFSGRVNGTFNITDGTDLQLSYFYRPPFDISNGRITAMHGADIGLKQSLFNKRASLALRVSDIFNTRQFSMIRDTEEYYLEVDRQRTSRAAWLTFSWNFGQSQDSNRKRTRTEDEGEREAPPGIDF